MSYCLNFMPSSRLKGRPEDPSHLLYRHNVLGNTLYVPYRQLNHTVLSEPKTYSAISLTADIFQFAYIISISLEVWCI